MKTRTVYKRDGRTIKDETREVTEEERRRLEEDYKRTHPETVARISGCCDRAE